MKHSIPHDLPIATARLAARKALDTYQRNFAEYQPRGRWITENRAEIAFTVMRKTLTGALDVRERQLDLELEVPLLFRAFRGAAMKVIEDEINMWLTRARNGELDETSPQDG